MKKWVMVLSFLLSIGSAWGAEKAYNFVLPQLNSSKKVAMKSYKKRVVLLNMWASWCGGCRKEMPLLDKLARRYYKKGLRIIGANLDNKQKKGQKFVKKFQERLGKKSAILFVYDKNKATAKAYKAKGFPLTVLIRKGKVFKTYTGSFNESNEATLIADIEAALK